MTTTIQETNTTDQRAIAEKFVDLTLSKEFHLLTPSDPMPEDQMRIFLDLMKASGKIAGSLVPGRIRRKTDQSGYSSFINNNCHYKVLDEEGKTLKKETGWLDEIIGEVLHGRVYNYGHEKLIENVVRRINTSVPFAPIQLNSEGEEMISYIDHDGEFLYTMNIETDTLREWEVGNHRYCKGVMRSAGATKDKNSLYCRKCHVRALFPKTVKTYGDLRKALAEAIGADRTPK